MATLTLQLPGSGVAVKSGLPSFSGLRLSLTSTMTMTMTMRAPSSVEPCRSSFVRAATVVSPTYTSVKPLGDRVLVKIKSSEEMTVGGGILLPSTAQSKPQGDGRTIGDNKVGVSVKSGAQVVYSKYAGTELELNGSNYMIVKEDDIVGVLEMDDVKDMKPLNDRVLIKVAESENKTAGGLLLTEATKEKPSIGTVVAVGPGPLDEEGNRKPLTIAPGSTVLYSKYAGNEFKGLDDSDYIVLRASDVMVVLS